MGAVDLCCAQPALLGLLIHSLLSPDSVVNKRESYRDALRCVLPPAVLRLLPSCVARCPGSCRCFIELVSVGAFNGCMASLTGLPEKGDDGAKHRVLVDVFAPKHPYPCPVRAAFESEFPGPAAVVRAINDPDYRNLIRLLQRLEAWLIFDQVAPRLVERVLVLSLHDALCGRLRDLDEIEATFRGTFDELGFQFSTKREPWTPKCPGEVVGAAA